MGVGVYLASTAGSPLPCKGEQEEQEEGTVIVWMVVSLPWRQMGKSQWSWALMMKLVINQTQSISMNQITILK